MSSEYVFLKVHRPSGLHQPYGGPLKVLEQRNNTFDIYYGDVIKKVHVDLLKPAYVDKSQPSTQPNHNKWKYTIVVPVYKSGQKSNVTNYRPISKLSNVAKLIEHIVNDKLLFMLRAYISPAQHGFFHDDLKIFSCIRNSVDVIKLQEDLDRLSFWTLSPNALKHINRIESVQKKFVKFALKSLNFSHSMPSYVSRCALISLQSLRSRREIDSLVFLQGIDTRYFKFEDRVYEQLKGMPMGSPASPIIADIIMEELLDDVFKKTTKPRVVTKYVDDIFAIIKRSDVEETLNALNSYNRQIQFTKEEELDQKLPYLDTIVHRQGNQLKLNWYQKPTASGRLLNFYSNHNKRIIINTATNFIRRLLSISDPGFHLENEEKIRKILTNNDFPKRTIQNLINKVKSKQMNNKNENNEKVMKIYKPVTYIAGFSERLCKSDIYDKDKYQLALKTTKTVKGLFSKTKTKIKNDDKSNIIYKIKCKGDKSNLCQKTYIGTTMTKLKTRLSSHKSDIKATDKPMEQKTALAAHCAQTGHKPNFEGVEILDHENNYRRRFTLEMLHIINTPPDERMNYKKDIENCARIYRHTIQKHNRKLNSV
ncbi:uncharacterized protein LOC142239767 [Haematobia irritans]|uniref:uncharacterized protein LOC142239767 n=1 Tax=Haematobia irritans TaxID=7368 RepID=UPI003F509E4B